VDRHALIGTLINALITRGPRVQIPPATKSTGVLRLFLRTHRPLTSMFGRRPLYLWGQSVGAHSAPACAG
jgi:hypothetical protein